MEGEAAKPLLQAANEVVLRAFGVEETRETEVQFIPILADAIAAGNPLTIDEKDIAGFVPMLPGWLPSGGLIYAVKVEGDSMEPTLADGYLAFIDVAKKDPKKLIDHMVAARIDDGFTIKWLRRSGKHLTLVPQHSSPRHQVRVLDPEDDWAIVGEVIRWVGAPPPPPKKRTGL